MGIIARLSKLFNPKPEEGFSLDSGYRGLFHQAQNLTTSVAPPFATFRRDGHAPNSPIKGPPR